VPQQAGPPPEVPQQAAQPAAAPPAAAPAAPAASKALAAEPAATPARTADAGRPAIVPSSLRGTTEKLSRSRQVIAQRMVESLQTSAQLTTVVEADVTAIARLRDRAKGAFEAREGVKLSFLPFFALATVEALKVHPRLNAIIDTGSGQVTYHDAEHLGIAVDTERGLMVPVIRKAGDLNIAGLARKIADLAARTRAGQVGPDDLSGGTFTLTNTGSRGALFDTPIINQPQVGILGTGTVVRRWSWRTRRSARSSRCGPWSTWRSPTITGWSTGPTPRGSWSRSRNGWKRARSRPNLDCNWGVHAGRDHRIVGPDRVGSGR